MPRVFVAFAHIMLIQKKPEHLSSARLLRRRVRPTSPPDPPRSSSSQEHLRFYQPSYRRPLTPKQFRVILSAFMPLPQGTQLGPYTIVALLGQGGMGLVYRARDERLQRDVAIKVLPPGLLSDEPAKSRFRKEALALARLSHPNIAAVFD